MPQLPKSKSKITSPKTKEKKNGAKTDSTNSTEGFSNGSENPSEKIEERSPVLAEAWHKAMVLETTYFKNVRDGNKLYQAVLTATVLSIALAVIYDALKPIDLGWVLLVNKILKYLVILAPITVSILVSMSVSSGANVPREFLEKNMSSVANNLDAKSPKTQSDLSKVFIASQLIMREIYLFRAKYGEYKNNPENKTREQILGERMNSIQEQLSKTGAIRIGLEPFNGPVPPYYYPGDPDSDPGFHDFTGDEYFRYRTNNMLLWFSSKTNRLGVEKKRLMWRIYGIGGLGTFLAAVGLEIWLAVTSSIVGALTSTLEQRKIDQTIAAYNQTATELGQIRVWWLSLTDHEKKLSENVEELVVRTENALTTEDQQKDFWGKKKQTKNLSD